MCLHLTNVGVDDVVEVNSSTLCVFGVEPPSDATVPDPRYFKQRAAFTANPLESQKQHLKALSERFSSVFAKYIYVGQSSEK